MAADPLSTVALSTVVTTVSHLIRSYAQDRHKNSGALVVAEVKDRASFTIELIKRLEKVEKDHDNCEKKHDDCLAKVSSLTSKIDRLEARVSHIEPN